MAVAVSNVGKPERFARWVWVVVGLSYFPKPKRRFLGGLCAWFGWFMVGARVVGGGLYGDPMCFVGRMVALWLSGNSLGFRGL